MNKERRAAVQRAFGDRMRMLRHRLGFSQDEFALRSGLHRTYIGAVERGECNITLVNVARIAETLEVPPAALLEETEPAG
ncbi:MAG: helix-turn-helix transcriptional regulator [Chloroflexi bacterium]|nr:helix-turn-helix transcriptional regulator [Chloroflexota bacterium]